MSSELLAVLDAFKQVCDDWNLHEIKTERDLIDTLRVLNKRLQIELDQKSIFPEDS